MLRPFLALGYGELYALTFSQSTESLSVDSAKVYEYIWAVFLFDEAKTLGFVEELNGAEDHVGHILVSIQLIFYETGL